MRIAVVGAGIVGVTTAYELQCDGHEVVVFERRASVAEETSFANAGVVAPGYVAPWAAPGMPRKMLGHLAGRHAPLRIASLAAPGQWRWMWRWWRSCDARTSAGHRACMHRLARDSHDRLRALSHDLRLDFERTDGYLVLLRSQRELKQARTGLRLLAELGESFHLVDATRARQIEPGLNPETPLLAAIHLPGALVGNCRQFAHLLRLEAQRRGADFRFQHEVQRVEPGSKPSLHAIACDTAGGIITESFDAVVLCAALPSLSLLAPLGVRVPMIAVHGYSITAPLRHFEGHPDIGPRSAIMDEQLKVAVSRLGQRVRVAGSAELGGRLDNHNPAALGTLYKVLDDWFPGCAQLAQVQAWKGARPMLPDGPPVIGRAGPAGVWLNLGHGSSGWALCAGSARLLADLVAGRAPAIDPSGLTPDRLR